MKKSLLSLLFSLVATSCLLAQLLPPPALPDAGNDDQTTIQEPALPPAHLEATYNCNNNNPSYVKITWSADRQNDPPPYQYKTTVTINNHLSTVLSGWTLGIPGASTKLVVDNPEGGSLPSFVILSYNFYDYDTQQVMTAPFKTQMVETAHYNFTSGDPNQGQIITGVIFAGNAFRPSSQSNTVNIQPSASLTFSYTTEIPVSSKLVMAAPASIAFAYSIPHLDMLVPDQVSE